MLQIHNSLRRVVAICFSSILLVNSMAFVAPPNNAGNVDVGVDYTPESIDNTAKFIPVDRFNSSKNVSGYIVLSDTPKETTIFVMNDSDAIVVITKTEDCMDIEASTDDDQMSLRFENDTAIFTQNGIMVGAVFAPHVDNLNQWGLEFLAGNTAFEALVSVVTDVNLKVNPSGTCISLPSWNCVKLALIAAGKAAVCAAAISLYVSGCTGLCVSPAGALTFGVACWACIIAGGAEVIDVCKDAETAFNLWSASCL
jgi:hypothetical protein